jgi:two-component system chemotaxis response regulator CheB
MSPRSHDLVAIGASWGGLGALRSILAALPGDLDATIVVAQHRSPESHPSALLDLLRSVTALEVCEADDKQPLRRGVVHLAPASYHLLVERDALALSTDAVVSYARPSLDVLFESAAEAFRDRCVGVVLTGANHDGAHGLARIVELGGAALVQDPATATRPEMPRAAVAAVPAARVVRLDELAPLLVELCGRAKVPA